MEGLGTHTSGDVLAFVFSGVSTEILVAYGTTVHVRIDRYPVTDTVHNFESIQRDLKIFTNISE